MKKRYEALIWIGILMIAIGAAYAYGSSNSTGNMTLDCVRMFYSDSWDKGYVIDMAKYCNSR